MDVDDHLSVSLTPQKPRGIWPMVYAEIRQANGRRISEEIETGLLFSRREWFSDTVRQQAR